MGSVRWASPANCRGLPASMAAGPVARDHWRRRRFTKEGDMNRFNWNAVIQSLVLVRLGQELGSESEVARAIHELVTAVLAVCR